MLIKITLPNHGHSCDFLCFNLMNYLWVWKIYVIHKLYGVFSQPSWPAPIDVNCGLISQLEATPLKMLPTSKIYYFYAHL